MPKLIISPFFEDIRIAQDQYFTFADAYLKSAILLCKQLPQDASDKDYPFASVICYLSHHAVELFLKGAIAINTNHPVDHVHSLEKLHDIFSQSYSQLGVHWPNPFSTVYLGNPSKEELARLKKENKDFSLLYRYPMKNTMQQWSEVNGITKDEFLYELQKISFDFRKILSIIHINDQSILPFYRLKMVFPEIHPGVALRGYRARECMTQKALAAKLGICASYLSGMERGHRSITTSMAKRIGEATDIGWKLLV